MEKEPMYTTGEFEIKSVSIEDGCAIVKIGAKQDNRHFCEVISMPNEDIEYSLEEARANANLILSIPGLLKELAEVKAENLRIQCNMAGILKAEVNIETPFYTEYMKVIARNAELEKQGQDSLLLYNSMTKNIEQLKNDFFKTVKELRAREVVYKKLADAYDARHIENGQLNDKCRKLEKELQVMKKLDAEHERKWDVSILQDAKIDGLKSHILILKDALQDVINISSDEHAVLIAKKVLEIK